MLSLTDEELMLLASLMSMCHTLQEMTTLYGVVMAHIQRNRNIILAIDNIVDTAPIYWVMPRPATSWIEHTLFDLTVPERVFVEKLRIKRQTFLRICQLCLPGLSRKQTNWREPLSPEKVLAVGIYRLAHGTSFQVTCDVFNIGKTTAKEAFDDVVHLLSQLRSTCIKFPASEQERAAVVSSFSNLSPLPNIIGAIDGTHVKIKGPEENSKDYYSRYQQFDVICQGVVDGKCKFIDFATGYPGSLHDARVFRNSTISKIVERGFLRPTVQVGEKVISPYLVGDSAYPISTSLLKPYSDSTRDPREKKFNKALSKARVQVERAFGMLKGRFRILLNGLEDKLDDIPHVILACCVLHNICVDSEDIWPLENVETDRVALCALHAGNIEGEALREFLKNFIFEADDFGQ